MNKYPTNFTEAIISAIPNCTTMVIGMVTMNLFIYGHLTWDAFLHAAVMIWPVAFLLDFIFVGPLVSRIIHRFSIPRAMPFIRVGLMAGILTALAPMLESGMHVTLGRYLIALPRNYIAALVLQVFVAMRIGLYVLSLYRKCKKSK